MPITEREAEEKLVELLMIELMYADERDHCAAHPANLLERMTAEDERTGQAFRLMDDEWEWQRDLVSWFHAGQRSIALKARQLGVTWLACGYVAWTALYKPGSLCLVYRQKEEEAFENVGRIWTLMRSLPEHLWNGAEVLLPAKGHDAKSEIRLRFKDGKTSRIVAMTSASASGHGKTAAVVLLDEFSRIERAAEIMKAVQPAAGRHGKLIVVSTANGVANTETGEGNYFHYLWANADNTGFSKRFLGWNLHPERDEHWYQHDPEIRGLRNYERAEQYPSNPDEAFALTSNNFFEQDEISFYGNRVPPTLGRHEFQSEGVRQARLRKRSNGLLHVYREPDSAHKYAIGADVADGTGRDFSAACVIDLANMEIAAEFYGLIDPDQFAFQLHYLGKWYGKSSGCPVDALIAVEKQGGYGNAVIVPLRDGKEGRPWYSNLYIHPMGTKPTMDRAKVYGFPMGESNRPNVVSAIGKAVREGYTSDGVLGLPWIPRVLMDEAKTIVRGPLPGQKRRPPYPRAQEGAKDDMFMATGIALELYRQRGEHPDVHRRKPEKPKASRPWQQIGKKPKRKRGSRDESPWPAEAA